jgi:hypothetical protein
LNHRFHAASHSEIPVSSQQANKSAHSHAQPDLTLRPDDMLLLDPTPLARGLGSETDIGSMPM